MKRRLAAVAAAALFAGGLAGCGDESERPELVVFAATSLSAAFEEYASGFEGAEVRFSFAGSDELAAQIRQGVEPDVYAAANTALPEDLAAEGLLDPPRAFIANRLVVGVPAGSPIDGVSDLEEPGVTVAIGDPNVPVGAYTRQVLRALGHDAERAIRANVATQEPDVGGIVAKIDQGAVDAGFVYRSDVAASDGGITAVAIPPSADPDVEYGIAVGSGAAEPGPAQDFVDGLLKPAGQEVLIDSGFEPLDE